MKYVFSLLFLIHLYTPSKAEQCNSAFEKGLNHYKNNQFDSSKLYFKLVLLNCASHEIGGRASNNIGLIFKHQSRYDSAIYYLIKSILILEKNKNGYLANSYKNLGETYILTTDFKKAKDNLEIAKKSHPPLYKYIE